MNTSARIKIIRQIADRLSDDDWDIIELTLRQFGLPTNATNGGARTYIVENIEGASEEQLIELAHHMGLAVDAAMSPSDGGVWVEGQFRLFITHLAADQEFASALKAALSTSWISGFVAHVDIEPTKEWEQVIENALFTADALTALMTKKFKASNWVDQEIGIAIGRRLLVVPLRAGLDPYGFIGKYQAISVGTKSPAVLAGEIFNVLGHHPTTKRRLAEVIVSAFTEGYSWESTRSLMGLLEQLPILDADLMDRVTSAVKTVEKIKTSFGVPNRVKRLVERES